MNQAASTDEFKRKLHLSLQTGLLLNKSFDLEIIVQAATDAGLELCGAEFGAFFYNRLDEVGDNYWLYTTAGVDREAFSGFPMLRNTDFFAPAFIGASVIRCGDITQDPHSEGTFPNSENLEGHFSMRSYLAVPVVGQTGEVFGGLFYGHSEKNRFEETAEELVMAVAAQAAAAIQNTRLRDELTLKIADLEASHRAQTKDAARLAEFEAIVNSSSDAILSTDMRGLITSWNGAATRMLEFSREEMIGNSVYNILPLDRFTDETEILERVRMGEHVEPFETVRLTKSGGLVDVSLSAFAVRNAQGEVIGLSKSLRDISGRKRLEASLIQSEKIAATGRMAASIAHEINNPLEAITNLLYLVRPAVHGADAEAYLNTAEAELMRVSHITKQALGYYREHAPATSASLSILASQTLNIYEPRCTANGVELIEHLEATRELVLRRGEIMQVISNLISNAIYAMPHGGQLEVTTQDVTEPIPGVLLSIRDSGIGIPNEILPRIFEAFFTTRSAIGMGIGLYVAKDFVEGHGGTIHISSSTSNDHGTRVEVFLPTHTPYAQSLES